jgi:hypothetical protein
LRYKSAMFPQAGAWSRGEFLDRGSVVATTGRAAEREPQEFVHSRRQVRPSRFHAARQPRHSHFYPSIGSIVSHQRGSAMDGVPVHVVMGCPDVTRGPGFLSEGHRSMSRPDIEAAVIRPVPSALSAQRTG